MNSLEAISNLLSKFREQSSVELPYYNEIAYKYDFPRDFSNIEHKIPNAQIIDQFLYCSVNKKCKANLSYNCKNWNIERMRPMLSYHCYYLLKDSHSEAEISQKEEKLYKYMKELKNFND